MTSVYIHSWPGGDETLKRHWPLFVKTGHDLIGVEPTDSACDWPDPKPLLIVKASMDKEFRKGDANLCWKLIRTLEHFLTTNYSDAFVTEYDSILLGPLPDHPGGLATYHALGGNPYGKAQAGYHPPWWADRQTAKVIIECGTTLIQEGDIDDASPDWFIGRVADRCGIKITKAPAWSVNHIDSPHLIQEARKAISAGAIAIHGIKDESALTLITA